MELKKRPEHFNFFLNEDISDSSYSSLKKEVFDKIEEIRKIDEENEQFGRIHNIDVSSMKTRVSFVFHISTYGGYVYDGLGICDMLHKLEENDMNIEVSVICEGKIMSMGIPIILSVKNRVCTPHTTFMIHQILSFGGGKLADMKEEVGELERLWGMCKDIIVNNSRITKEMLDEWDKCRADTYFDAHKALEWGIVKEII